MGGLSEENSNSNNNKTSCKAKTPRVPVSVGLWEEWKV
jgi:hypothetical protein